MRCTKLVVLIALVPSLVWAASVTTPIANPPDTSLYDYRNKIELQDDFLGGLNTNGTIGGLGWTVGGSGLKTNLASTAGMIGLLQLNTNTSSAVASVIALGSSSAQIDPAQAHTVLWRARLNTNDANTTVRLGSQNTGTANPPNEGIFLEKLDGDTNWFCVTRAASTQTRVDSTVAVSTSVAVFAYERSSAGVTFTINGASVCGVMTTNIPTVFVNPTAYIINSAAAAKTIDLDYFQLVITGFTR